MEAEYRHNPITGEDDLYVTEWELFEGSTTSVPSNAGAITLKIYTPDGQLVPDRDIRLHMENIVKLCAESKTQGKISNIKNMDKITLTAEAYVALGITADTEGAPLSAAIVKLHGDLKAANDKVTAMEAEKATERQNRAELLVRMAIDSGRITAADKSEYMELAISNYTLAEKALNSIPEKVNLSGKVTPVMVSDIPSGREGWTHLHWLKEDPKGLAKIKTENPETFAAIKEVRK